MTDLSSLSDEQLMAMAGQSPLASISNSILGQESGNNPNIGSSIDGAIGQGQILPSTFAQYARPGESINNPADNLAVHQRIIADLSARSGGDPARIAVGYFSGPGNIAPPDSPTPWKSNRADGNGKTTSSYVSDILGRMGNAIVPSAQASEMPAPQSSFNPADYSNYTDEQLQAIASQGLKGEVAQDVASDPDAPPAQTGVAPYTLAPGYDPTFKGDQAAPGAAATIPTTVDSSVPRISITHPSKPGPVVVDPSLYDGYSDEQLKQIAGGQTHEDLLGQNIQDMGKPGASGAVSQLGAYGLNALQGIPLVGPYTDEAGSALGALAGAGQGSNFSQRYDNLQRRQQATREAGQIMQPRIQTPSYLPDITPTGLAQAGSGLVSTPLGNLVPAVTSPSLIGAVTKAAGLGALGGAVSGYGNGDSFADNNNDRLQNALTGAGTGAAVGAGFGAVQGVAQKIANSAIKDAPAAAVVKQDARNAYKDLESSGNAGALNGGAVDRTLSDMSKAVSMPERVQNVANEVPGLSGFDHQKYIESLKKNFGGTPMTLKEATALDAQLSGAIRDDVKPNGENTSKGATLLSMQNVLRDAIVNPAEKDVIGSKEAFALRQKAVKAWATAAKMGDIERIIHNAKFSTNPEVYMTSQMARIARSPKLLNSYPKEVRPLIEKMAEPTATKNELRTLSGKFLHVGATLVAGSHNPILGLLAHTLTGGAGAAAKHAGESIAHDEAQNILNALYNGNIKQPYRITPTLTTNTRKAK